MARTRRPAGPPLRTVAVLALPDLPVFELAVACEVFGLDRTEMGVPRTELLVCAGAPTPITSNAGFTIDTPYDLSDVDRADTVIVPGWHGDVDEISEDVIHTLQRAYARGARVMSFCSGAFVLAAAGLLNGKRATTHWMHAAELARRFPEIDVDPSVLYIDEGRVLTSAGTASGIDLCLHLVRMHFGAEAANTVARRMVVPPHRDGGQSQYVEAPMATTECDDQLGPTLEWAIAHLDRDLTVQQLARRASMSARTFARRFRAATGTTPLQWLLTQRVIAAQRMLETTELSIDHVASRCGFGSSAALRMHFRRQVGTSPQSYRATFCPEMVAS